MMVKQSDNSQLGVYPLVDKHTIKERLGLSSDMLKSYRRQGFLQEEIHWIRINTRVIRYNLVLIADWIQNRNDPVSHQRAIDRYFKALPSNQSRRRASK